MYHKLIGCSIYGQVKISEMALKIIDTPEFQRLKNIKQLGVASYVFPAATHTRFEHSLGVYHLSQLLTTILQQKYPDMIFNNSELGTIKLDFMVCFCIAIAGLLHDIGHACYSHLIDHYLHTLPTANENACHETRSCKLVELICKRELRNELSDKHINFIKSLISPNPEIHTGALYQIIANHFNNIDLDKFDYLVRDAYSLGLNKGFDARRLIDNIIIDNRGNLAYAKHCSTELYDMFQTRYMMHKKVYNHRTCKIIESMISDILILVEPVFNISKMIDNMGDLCKLTDNTIFFWLENAMQSSYFLNIHLDDKSMDIIKKAYIIYQNIVTRKLYKIISETDDIEHLNNFMLYLQINNIDTNCLEISSVNIGFVSNGNKNPFDSIYFYDNKKPNGDSFLLNKGQISSLLTDTFMEVHNYLICKDRNIYSHIMNMYNDFINL